MLEHKVVIWMLINYNADSRNDEEDGGGDGVKGNQDKIERDADKGDDDIDDDEEAEEEKARRMQMMKGIVVM